MTILDTVGLENNENQQALPLNVIYLFCIRTFAKPNGFVGQFLIGARPVGVRV